MAQPSLSDLVRTADLVVRGRITGSEAVKQTFAINDRGDTTTMVFTYLTIDPVERLKSDGSAGNVVVRLWGGFWEGKAIADVDAPQIPRDQGVFFLKAHPRPGRATDEVVYELPYMKHGVFGISTAMDSIAVPVAGTASLGIAGRPGVTHRGVRMDVLRDLVSTATALRQ